MQVTQKTHLLQSSPRMTRLQLIPSPFTELEIPFSFTFTTEGAIFIYSCKCRRRTTLLRLLELELGNVVDAIEKLLP